MNEVTELLRELKLGDREALDKLMPVVYDELRAIAARYLSKERVGHTLQTTALVHEVYVRLVDQKKAQWADRAHFFAFAATLIRRILVDHARSRGAAKRGGERERVPLNEQTIVVEDRDVNLLALDEAMNRLAKMDERKSRVVELRYFGGLGVAETAEALAVSPATIERDWSLARAWLHREVSGGETDGS